MSCGTEARPRNLGFEYVELSGKKVRLRPTTAADARTGYALIHNNHDIIKWLCWAGPKTREEMVETYGVRWPQQMREGSKYSFAIEEIDHPGALIGCIDARVLLHPQQLEAGYWLGVPFWGKGYTSEALALVCGFCFKHLGAAVVTAGAFAGNIASRRVQEKNGFQYEGLLRHHIFKDGRWIDLWHLSLLREEWQKSGFKPALEKLVPASKEG